jgi:hypothetical protein
MQRETSRQGSGSRGLYCIDESFGINFVVAARRYNLNFHSIQTSATFDANRGGLGDRLRIDPEMCREGT